MAVIDGTSDDNVLTGTAGADRIYASGGSDTVTGLAGNDAIYGYGLSTPAAVSAPVTAELITGGFARPVALAAIPDDPERLLIAEQHTGRIRIMDIASASVEAAPLLDIPDNQLSTGGEQGLLGFVLHPGFSANGLFYVNLTNASGNTEIREYRTKPGSLSPVDPANGRLILTITQPFDNHNGGWLEFGPDGYLYIASGDGGSGGDPNNNGQNINTLLGKILRININGDDFPGDTLRNYAIPASNPFVGVAGADEIWAFGLRNPWRNTFDPVTGDLYIADVGQVTREEIDFEAAGSAGGRNYGWRIMEGTFVHDPSTPPGPGDPSLVAPIHEYGHVPAPNGGYSITGGVVYRGAEPGLDGAYLFTDFLTAQIWTLTHDNGASVQVVNRTPAVTVSGGSLNLIASFGTDLAGQIYTVGLDGEIHRLTFAAATADAGNSLSGGAGDDRLFGGDGNDTIDGDDDNDTLVGGQGIDVLRGNDGDDDITFGIEDALVEGGAGTDTARNSSNIGMTFDLAARGFERYFAGSGGDTILTSGTAAIIAHGGGGDDRVAGATGADRLSGGSGSDTVAGGDGDDTVIGGTGLDRLSGEAGDDTLFFDPQDAAIDGGSGFDTAVATTSDGLAIRIDAWNVEQLFAGGGSDRIYSLGTGAIRVDGGLGDDTIEGTISGDVLGGSGGNDIIMGYSGNDTLGGGAGSDRLMGMEGADLIFGEADPDAYIYRGLIDAGDTIIGFQTFVVHGFGNDRLEIYRSGFLQPGQANFGFLDPNRFVAGQATLATGQFLFDTNTGYLFWDGDGTGAGVAQLLLTVQGVGNLSANDIVLV
jgi:glucose/arabinose dehydrogenase